MTEPARNADPKAYWVGRLGEFLPGFFADDPALSRFAGRESTIFYGSLARGIDDEFADVDVWLLLAGEDFAELTDCAESLFFQFQLDGREGHVTAHLAQEFAAKVHGCDMDTIYQLRHGQALTDNTGAAGPLIELARQPMGGEVSRALFLYHYVEMRSEHRACDNPIDRNDPVALLLSLPKAIAHALRAAMVLDGEVYPYDKWLHSEAVQTPTGSLLAPSVAKILDMLAADGLRLQAREHQHPISNELRAVRGILIDAARAHGLDEPWLTQWWLYMTQAADAMKNVRWPGGGEANDA